MRMNNSRLFFRSEQILQAAPHKTAAVRPLAFYLTKESKDELRSNDFLWTKHMETSQKHIYLLCADTRCPEEDLLRAMDCRDGL